MAKIRITESVLQDAITESIQNIIAEKNLKELNEDYSVDLNKMGPPEGGGNSYYNDAMRYNGGSFNSEKSSGGLYKQLADMGYSQPQIVRGINSGAVRIGKIKDGNFEDRTNTGARGWWGRNIWRNTAQKAQRQMDRLGRYASRQGGSTRSQDIQAVYAENQQLTTQVNNYKSALSQITQEIDKVIALYTPAQSNPNESRISKKRTKILKEEEAGAATVSASTETGEAVEGLKDLLAKIAGIGKQITALNGQLTWERKQRATIQQQLNNANTSLKQYQQNTANTQAGAQQAATRNQTAVQGNTGAQTTQPKTQLEEQWKRMIQRMNDADL